MITIDQKYGALIAHGYDCDTRDGEITAWRDARPQPESWEAIIETVAALPSVIRETARAALAEQWAALPAWIRGPYGARYAEVVRLLDANDDDAAIAIVEYAAPPAGYDEEKKAVFDLVHTDLLAALQRIKTH
jgi:hypothetical protein